MRQRSIEAPGEDAGESCARLEGRRRPFVGRGYQFSLHDGRVGGGNLVGADARGSPTSGGQLCPAPRCLLVAGRPEAGQVAAGSSSMRRADFHTLAYA